MARTTAVNPGQWLPILGGVLKRWKGLSEYGLEHILVLKNGTCVLKLKSPSTALLKIVLATDGTFSTEWIRSSPKQLPGYLSRLLASLSIKSGCGSTKSSPKPKSCSKSTIPLLDNSRVTNQGLERRLRNLGTSRYPTKTRLRFRSR